MIRENWTNERRRYKNEHNTNIWNCAFHPSSHFHHLYLKLNIHVFCPVKSNSKLRIVLFLLADQDYVSVFVGICKSQKLLDEYIKPNNELLNGNDIRSEFEADFQILYDEDCLGCIEKDRTTSRQTQPSPYSCTIATNPSNRSGSVAKYFFPFFSGTDSYGGHWPPNGV